MLFVKLVSFYIFLWRFIVDGRGMSTAVYLWSGTERWTVIVKYKPNILDKDTNHLIFKFI